MSSTEGNEARRAHSADDVVSDNESHDGGSLKHEHANKAREDALMLEFAAKYTRTVREELGNGGYVDDDSDEDVDSEGADSGKSVNEALINEREQQFAQLHEIGSLLREASAHQLAGVFRKGRVSAAGPRMLKERGQKVFAVPGNVVCTTLEDLQGVCDMAARGPIVTSVLARTGLGKTRVFPAMLAKTGKMRVLMIEPDMVKVGDASKALATQTNVRKRWSKFREEMVVMMTVADFVTQFFTRNGERLLEQFDAIVLDEGSRGDAYTYAAKAILATLYTNQLSVIVLSATFPGEDVQALNEAPPPVKLMGDLMSMARDGALFSSVRRRDRTCLIVATDSEAEELRYLIQSEGMVAFVLDSASKYADVESVFDALSQPSMNLRYVVMVNLFGVGTNLPISTLYSDATEIVCKLDQYGEPQMVRQGLPLMDIKQHAARLNRGIVAGGNAYVFNDDIAQMDAELYEHERLTAYLLLRAVGIKPLKSVLPDLSMIPFGITDTVAANILAINLPPAVAIRYFTADGTVPAAYASALTLFSHNEHYFVATAASEVVGGDHWVSQNIGGYYGMAEARRASVMVPANINHPETRAKLHVIAAAAAGKISFNRYVVDLSGDETSDIEMEPAVQPVVRDLLPRRIEKKMKPLPAIPPKRYAYAVPAEDQFSLTRMIDSGSYLPRSHVYAGHYTEDVEDVPLTPILEETGRDGKRRALITASEVVTEDMQISSPGGTIIANIRMDAWKTLCNGDALPRNEAVSLFKAIRETYIAFANSDVLLHWNNVWIGIYKTLADEEVLRVLAQQNLIKAASGFFYQSYLRFQTGVDQLVNTSYVKKRFWDKSAGGKVGVRLEKAKKKGQVEIAQSERFLKRISDIRLHATKAIEAMQKFGVFDGIVSTMVQDVVSVRTASAMHTSMDDVSESIKRGKNRYMRVS